MSKILITGANGFIGSHLCNLFLSRGYEVIGLDLSAPPNAEKIKFYALDLLTTSIDEILKIHKPDICIHCAGPASVPNSLVSLENDFKLTVMPTFNILSSIRNYRPECKFLYLSSAAVYGNPRHLPVPEEETANPISPYGFHKLQAENICMEFFKLFTLPIALVRIFSAYGEGLQKQLLWDINLMIKQEGKVELFGTGEETRDFINIVDLVSAIRLIAEKSAFKGDIYNIANGCQIKVRELAQLLIEEYSFDISMRFNGQVRPGDPLYWQADIGKIVALGYQQQILPQEGVRAYVNWFRQIE
jgi:Nucleoside-diphosphate-sugar epimerases